MTQVHKQFNSDITWLKNNGGKEQSRAQSAMVNIAKHTVDCGDWTALNKLIECKIVNKQQAIVYVRALFKGIKYDKKLNLFIKKSKKTTVSINVGLYDTDYTEYSNEGTPTLNYDNLFTVRMIEQVINKIARAKESGATVTGDEQALVVRMQAFQKAVA